MSVYTSEDKTLKPELRGDASKGDQTLVEYPEDHVFLQVSFATQKSRSEV